MPRIIEKMLNKLPPEITSLQEMFSDTLIFNQDLSQWDTANVTNMSYMFYEARSFNQDISLWNVNKIKNTMILTLVQEFIIPINYQKNELFQELMKVN